MVHVIFSIFFLFEIPWQAVVWGMMLAFVVWPTCQTNKSSHILQSCIQAYFSSLKSRNLTLIYFFNDDSLLVSTQFFQLPAIYPINLKKWHLEEKVQYHKS